jgi:signal transduction histidine kinase
MTQAGRSLWRTLLDSEGDESAAPDDATIAGYRSARIRSIADRVPLMSLLFVFFIGSASLIEAWFFSARRHVLLLVCSVELIVCTLQVVSARRRPGAAWPITIAATAVLIGCMSWYFALTHGSSEMHAIGLTLFLAGTAVVYPWGAPGQSCASVAAVVAFALALASSTVPSLPVVYGLFSLATAALLTTLGAHLLDQHRWLAFRHDAELRRANELQRQEVEFSTALLNLTQALNAALHDPRATAEQLTTQFHQALGVDFAGTYLLDETRNVFRLIALSGGGQPDDLIDEIRAVELVRGAFPLHAVLEREGVVEITDRDTQDLVPRALLERWRIRSIMFATIASGRHLIGAIVGGYSERRGPFSATQHRLLRGFAQHAAAALENARLMEAAREANQMKSEFVATVSHELRTPLNVVLGYADLLIDRTLGDLNAEQHDALTRLRARSLHLLDLIQDILDINRLESGRVPLTIEDFTIGEVLRSVQNAVPAAWRLSGVALDFDSTHDHIVLRSDRAKVEMIVRNLVHNALKYTERGCVSIAVTSRPATRALELVVRDTGPGIPENELPRIFEMFHQINGQVRPLQNGGVGLGLYIVRRLIEALGGTVTVHSEIGRGSEFVVSLPLEPTPAVTLREAGE